MSEPYATDIIVYAHGELRSGQLSREIASVVALAHERLGATVWCERIVSDKAQPDSIFQTDRYRLFFAPTDRAHHPLELEHVVRMMIEGTP